MMMSLIFLSLFLCLYHIQLSCTAMQCNLALLIISSDKVSEKFPFKIFGIELRPQVLSKDNKSCRI